MKAISTLFLFLFFIASQTAWAQTTGPNCTGFSVPKPLTTDEFNTATWGQTNGSFTYNSTDKWYEATSRVPGDLLTITSTPVTVNTLLPISVGAYIESLRGSSQLRSVRIEVLENGVVINCFQEDWNNNRSTTGASFNGLNGKTVQFRFVLRREDNNAESIIRFDKFALLMPLSATPQTCSGLMAPKPPTLDEFNTATWGQTNGSFTYNDTRKMYESTTDERLGVMAITSVPFTVTTGLAISVGATITTNTGNSNKLQSVRIEVLENGIVINCFEQGWDNNNMDLGASFTGLKGKTVQFRFILLRDNTGSLRTTYFDNFSLDMPAESALPVTFIDITARKLGNGVNVTWTVADEIDVRGYEIEGSTNGTTFSKIGYVPAARQSTYSFMDLRPQSGISYYRVRNIDIDGKFKYSTVARINLSTLITLKAFPLPATNSLTVEHGIGVRGTMTLCNAEGKAMQSKTVAEGTSQTTFDLSSLQRGLYLIRFVKENGSAETLKVIKQ